MPQSGIEPRPLGLKSVYHIAVKAGSYGVAVQVLINYTLPHIPPPFFFIRPIISTNLYTKHRMGYLHWAPNVAFVPEGIKPSPPGQK